jgi:hypothetical protein
MPPCHKCGVDKAPVEFRLRKSVATGKHYRGKVCKECHQEVSLAWRHRNPDRVRRYNKKQMSKPGAVEKSRKCALESHFRRKFGITTAQRDALLAAQDGCAICHTYNPTGKGWCVDHDHVTGKIRGILCAACNVGLGHFGDNRERLLAAAKYLGGHNEQVCTEATTDRTTPVCMVV